MKYKVSILRKISMNLWFSSLALFIFVSGIFFYLQYLHHQDEDRAIEYRVHELNNAYYFTLYKFEKMANIIFATLAGNQEVISLLAKRNDDNDDQIRKRLHRYLRKQYEFLQKFGLRQLHFHLPNNHSFLRMHRPKYYGDDLTHIRPSIAMVNKTKLPVQGFEEGRVYNGYRFVFPLLGKHGEHYGSVESSVSFNEIAIELEKLSAGKVLLLMKESVVNKKVVEKEKKNYLKSPFKGFLYDKENAVKYNIGDVAKVVHNIITPKLSQRMFNGEEFFVTSGHFGLGVSHIIMFRPIKNTLGKFVGYFVSYQVAPALSTFSILRLGGFISYLFILGMLLFINYIFIKLSESKQQQDKLYAVKAMAVSLNHEIRNPLAIVLGQYEILVKKYKLKESEPKALDRIDSALTDINNVFDEFSQLADLSYDQYINQKMIKRKQTDLK